MKNLKNYVYFNVGMRFGVPALLVIAIAAAYTQILYILLLVIPVLFLWLVFPLFGYQSLVSSGVKDTDILRDFVYARKCGPLIAGEKFVYRMRGLSFKIIPVGDIERIYGINRTVTQIGRYEKRVKRSLFVAIILKNGKQIKTNITENNRNIFLTEMSKCPDIRIGYEK